MADPQTIDLSAGLVPASNSSNIDLSSGFVTKAEAPAPTQAAPKPGFLKTLGSDLKGMLTPSGQNPYPGMGVEQKTEAAEQSVQEDQARKAAGYSPTYRAVAPIAQSLGVNVTGMEKSAAEGDVAGVVGHTVAAAAPVAVSELAKHVGVPTAKAVGVSKPAYLMSADELAGTTPARIAELKTVPEKVGAVQKLAVDTEAKAKAAAKAAYPEVNKPIVRTRVVEGDGTATDQYGYTLPKGRNVVQEEVPFAKVQEERAKLGEEIGNEEKRAAAGAPAYDLKALKAKYSELSDEMRGAAEADGKLEQYKKAEAGWKQFQDDFHNQNSPVRRLLGITPDQTEVIQQHMLGQKGARTVEVLRKYGADTSAIEKLRSGGNAALKTDVAESSKLRSAGSDENYRTQRLNEALDQATTNRIPNGPEAKLPASAMKSSAPGILKEVPGSGVISPRNVTRVKLTRALRDTLSRKP